MTVSEQASSVVDLDAALRPGAVVPVFQPIVDLRAGGVRAYEALARWPGHPQLTPDGVFAAAQAHARLVELDWTCRVAAVDAVLATPAGTNVSVFVNVEPESLASPDPQLLTRRWARDTAGMAVVLELTERSMLCYPAQVLRFVAEVRDRGMGVALDDVGADPGSLAMLDLVAPDVVKLDLKLVQHTPARDQARTLAAVMAYRERTGATVLAEGIETAAHLEQARSWGADLGQGWLFGRPAPLPATPVARASPLRLQPLPARTGRTPIDVARRHLPMQTAPKHLLLQLSHHIEELALDTIDTPMVLTALQSSEHLTPGTTARYARLARTAPLVAVLGRGVTGTPAPGVRGVSLTAADPLVDEWTVIVLGARTAAALIAHDDGDRCADSERRFTFAVTHDRDVVTQAARAVLDRV